MNTTIIKESEWCRGQKTSALLLHDHTKCCLGFDALRRGFTEEEILEIPTPEGLPHDDRLDGLVYDYSDEYGEHLNDNSTVNDIVRVNDNATLTDDERKTQLIALFLKLDTELVFVP